MYRALNLIGHVRPRGSSCKSINTSLGKVHSDVQVVPFFLLLRPVIIVLAPVFGGFEFIIRSLISWSCGIGDVCTYTNSIIDPLL